MNTELWREDLRALESGLTEKHIAPFATVAPEEFHAAVTGLDARIPDLTDEAIQVEMGRLVAMLHDGHTELWLAREGLGFRNYPFFLYDFDGEITVYVTADSHADLLGATVVAIDGVPIAEIRSAVAPLIARDNDVELLLSVPVYIGVPEILFGLGLIENADAARFSFDRAGERFDRVLEALDEPQAQATKWIRASDGHPPAPWAKHRDRSYWFEYLADGETLYVKYDRCQNQKGQPSIKSFAEDLFEAFDARPPQRLVLDLRNNRGGNYHKSKPLVEGIVRRNDRLGAERLFVITGRETFSAGMVTALQLKQRAHATLVGEPGRSAPNGCENFEWFHLPQSRLRVDYTDRLELRAPEYADLDSLPVDIEVSNRFTDYRDGRDRVLEAILVRDARP